MSRRPPAGAPRRSARANVALVQRSGVVGQPLIWSLRIRATVWHLPRQADRFGHASCSRHVPSMAWNITVASADAVLSGIELRNADRSARPTDLSNWVIKFVSNTALQVTSASMSKRVNKGGVHGNAQPRTSHLQFLRERCHRFSTLALDRHNQLIKLIF